MCGGRRALDFHALRVVFFSCRLFKAAVEDQLQRLKGEKDEREKQRRQLAETQDKRDAAELSLLR